MFSRMLRGLAVVLVLLAGLTTMPSAAAASAPSAPQGVRVDSRIPWAVQIAWAMPQSDGGSPVTQYTVTASPGGQQQQTDGQTFTTTFANLDSAVTYTFTATATNAVGTSPPSPPTDHVTPTTKMDTFTPIAPVRALDTRLGSGALGTGEVRSVHLPVPDYALSALINLTATNATAETYLTAYPNGASRPLASSVNVTRGATVPNLVTVPVSNGSIALYNNAGSTDVIVDVLGFNGGGGARGWVPVDPVRVADTRNGGGANPLIWPNQMISVTIPQATPNEAVLLNVTVVDATEPSYVTAYDCSTPPPTSNLNVVRGGTAANAVFVKTNLNRMVCFTLGSGRANLIVDLNGVASSSSTPSYFPRGPSRVLDTRTGTGAPLARLGAGQTIALGFPTFEAFTSAVTMNVTATNASAQTYLTAYPCGTGRPLASNLNVGPGQTTANQVFVGVGQPHQVCIYNNAGDVDVIADLQGYHIG